jgi:hypothetical protein
LEMVYIFSLTRLYVTVTVGNREGDSLSIFSYMTRKPVGEKHSLPFPSPHQEGVYQ